MKKIAFTLVLNGMRFLPSQMKIIPNNFDKWYIIEGAVTPTHCTSWCNEVPKHYLNDVNMSSDGTYEYLNQIDNPNIEIIRPERMANGKYNFWDGKLEMCNSFMYNMKNTILMQIDMDEFWGKNILTRVFELSENITENTIMQFRCNFFVGDRLITHGTDCYGDMNYEWNRLWIIKDDNVKWERHEPPTLNFKNPKFINKTQTYNMGLGFKHYAYMYEEQLKFKEEYYGYKNAVNRWKELQKVNNFPVYLRDYFPWVNDNAKVIKV